MYNEVADTSRYDGEKNISIQIKIIEKNESVLYTEYKLILIYDGEGIVKINRNEYIICKNSIINISPWTVVEFFNIKKPLNYIVLSYNRLFLKKFLDNENKQIKLFDIIDNYEFINLDLKTSKEIKKIMFGIREEIGDENILELCDYQHDKFSNLLVITKIIQMLIEISRNINFKEQKSDFSIGQSLIKYIYAHSSEKLTIMKLATIFFMSESTVRKYIERFSTLTFNELLYKIRLQKTEELLLYTDLNLEEIAQISGFVDGSHITKVWNMKKNMTPANYRQIYKSSFVNFTKDDKNLAFDIINFIKNNYYKQIDIYETSKKYGVNEVKINKLLLLYVDRNFSSFLNYTRINRACEMLMTTNENIIDICFNVGYNNIKTFNNNFIKYKQITPTEFKKRGETN